MAASTSTSTLTSQPTGRLHFPAKLYQIIESESPDIIRWQHNGRSFRICDHDLFQSYVIPKYFRHGQIASVQRQLNLYGFKCVARGENKGAFFHPSFVRGEYDNVRLIRRSLLNKAEGKVKSPSFQTIMSEDKPDEISTPSSPPKFSASNDSSKKSKKKAVQKKPLFVHGDSSGSSSSSSSNNIASFSPTFSSLQNMVPPQPVENNNTYNQAHPAVYPALNFPQQIPQHQAPQQVVPQQVIPQQVVPQQVQQQDYACNQQLPSWPLSLSNQQQLLILHALTAAQLGSNMNSMPYMNLINGLIGGMHQQQPQLQQYHEESPQQQMMMKSEDCSGPSISHSASTEDLLHVLTTLDEGDCYYQDMEGFDLDSLVA